MPACDALYVTALTGVIGTIGTVVVLLPVVCSPAAMGDDGAVGWLVRIGLALTLAVTAAGGLLVCRVGALPERLLARLPARLGGLLAGLRARDLRPRELAWPAALAIVSNAAGVVALYAALRAVGQRPGFLTLMATRAVGSLASHLAPVFQGGGLVEGSMTAVLVGAGGAGSAALAGALLFRVVQVWLPVVIGLLLLISLPARRPALPVRWVVAVGGLVAWVGAVVATVAIAGTPDVDADIDPSRVVIWESLLALSAAAAVVVAVARRRALLDGVLVRLGRD